MPVPPSRNDESGDARFSPPDVSISSARCAEVQLTSSTDAGARASANPLVETEQRSRGDPAIGGIRTLPPPRHVRLIDRRLIERIRDSSPLICPDPGTDDCVTISHGQVVIAGTEGGGERGRGAGTPRRVPGAKWPLCFTRIPIGAPFVPSKARRLRENARCTKVPRNSLPFPLSLSFSLSLSLGERTCMRMGAIAGRFIVICRGTRR